MNVSAPDPRGLLDSRHRSDWIVGYSGVRTIAGRLGRIGPHGIEVGVSRNCNVLPGSIVRSAAVGPGVPSHDRVPWPREYVIGDEFCVFTIRDRDSLRLVLPMVCVKGHGIGYGSPLRVERQIRRHYDRVSVAVGRTCAVRTRVPTPEAVAHADKRIEHECLWPALLVRLGSHGSLAPVGVKADRMGCCLGRQCPPDGIVALCR